MNKQKVRLIIEIILMIVLIILLGIITINVIKIEPNNKNKNTKEKIVELNELLINGGTKEQIKELIGIDADSIDSRSLMTGPDSYMYERPSDKIISENNLEKYVIAQEKYAKNVEKKIKSNFNYEIISVQKENDYKVYSVSLKSYYQVAYLIDLRSLEEYLIHSAKDDDDITKYKIKVSAMAILNENLDEYMNNDETCVANLYEYEDMKKTQKSFLAYLNQVQGINYHNEKIFVDNQVNLMTRLDSLIENAINKKIIGNDYLLI